MYNVYFADGRLASRVPCETFAQAVEYANVLSGFEWGWYIVHEGDGRVVGHSAPWSYIL